MNKRYNVIVAGRGFNSPNMEKNVYYYELNVSYAHGIEERSMFIGDLQEFKNNYYGLKHIYDEYLYKDQRTYKEKLKFIERKKEEKNPRFTYFLIEGGFENIIKELEEFQTLAEII